MRISAAAIGRSSGHQSHQPSHTPATKSYRLFQLLGRGDHPVCVVVHRHRFDIEPFVQIDCLYP